MLAAIGLTLLPDPPQQGRPLEVRVPLGVGAFQAASMRICHQQGVPIAEVLLVQGAGGVWSGVIDGRYLRGPRLGLWIRVRQQGSYRAVLGGVDDPVWIDVALEALEVRPSSGPGGVALLAIQKSNQRPAFGFADYSAGRELPRLLDQESDLFSRRRVDGRVVVMRHGRASDRAVSARLDLLEIIDPYDGSLVDFIYIEPGFSTRKDAFGFALRRHSPAGLSARVAGGTPGRGVVYGAWRTGRQAVAIDAVVDFLPSGLEVPLDHSAGLPSEQANRQIDDRGRGAFLSWNMGAGGPLAIAAGLLHRSDAGYFGLWDTLVHGEWRQRDALLLALKRSPRKSAKTQAQLDLDLGWWRHRDQRAVAAPGLELRDADGDGNPERFPAGVLFESEQQLWSGRLALEVSQKVAALRLGVRAAADGAGLISGGVQVNRGDSGIALGSLLSHPALGDRGAFFDGWGSGELVAGWQRGPWRLHGQAGAAVAPASSRPWTGKLVLAHRIPGRWGALSTWSKPQRRLLDRHLAPEGFLAKGLSDSMPFGATVLSTGQRLPSPFSAGVRFDGKAQVSRSPGVWRYGLNFGVEELGHSADGVDREGNASPYADDGPIRALWLAGRMDFAAYSGMRFHGSLWLGRSYARQIDGRGATAPGIDQPWVLLTEVPQWRWRNSIVQTVGKHWMTGGGLEAISPVRNSERHALTILHRFSIPSQVQIDAWMRYQRRQLGVTLRLDNAMTAHAVAPVPRPDRVPGLLPTTPRRLMLSVEWRPGGRGGSPQAF